MKVVILAGGLPSSISSENEGIPKPMVEIGGKPLLWHIMKYFSSYGLNEFIVCGGYRVDLIKEYFMDFYIYQSDITIDLQNNTVEVHQKKTEDWKVTVVDTGKTTPPGRRISMVQSYIEDPLFFVTYGDCLYDIDLDGMRKRYDRSGGTAMLALAKPAGRNQLLPVDEDGNLQYGSQTRGIRDNAWVNANCMLFHKSVFELLDRNVELEQELLRELSERGQAVTYKHEGYWQSVETKRDLVAAEKLWNQGKAPWMKRFEDEGKAY